MDGVRDGDEIVAVIVVDVQGDFTESGNGSLAVPDSDGDYVKQVESAVIRFREAGFLVLGTQDWHPPDHVSFAANHPGAKPGDVINVEGRIQALWPPHCVAGTDNARVVIDNVLFDGFIRKGQDPGYDSYSAFGDEGGNDTELDALLKRAAVRRVVIFGLATDYCVKYTVLDGLRRGYTFTVVEELSRGITSEDARHALEEMEREGAVIMHAFDVEKIGDL
jgi:nicotinamidase/pyrazinamidase